MGVGVCLGVCLLGVPCREVGSAPRLQSRWVQGPGAPPSPSGRLASHSHPLAAPGGPGTCRAQSGLARALWGRNAPGWDL